MNNGFVDGWANVLDVNVDVSAPTYLSTAEGDGLPDDRAAKPADEEMAVLFQNDLEAVGAELSFRHYLLPDAETVERLFRARSADRAIEFRKLGAFDRIAQRGANQVAGNLTKMSGVEMDVDIRRINFISLDAIPSEVSAEPMVGVAFSFAGTPSGYLLFLFDERSARTLVGRSLDTEISADLGPFEQDAIKEMSNVMASGMLDGWANLLDGTIDHSTPAYAHDMGAAVVDPLVVGLGESQEFAFVFDTRIEAVDTAVDFDIYVIPDETDLREALGAVEMGRVAGTQPQASTDLERAAANFGGTEGDPGGTESDLGGTDADLGRTDADPGGIDADPDLWESLDYDEAESR
jgi:chemotaxis protein CheC